MQLPKYDKNRIRRRKKVRLCKQCGREFIGDVNSKYCELHNIHNNREAYNSYRAKLRRDKVKKAIINNTNQHIVHSFSHPTDVDFVCALNGCDTTFRVKMLPKLFTYPKYCEYHRNENKRNQFLRRKQA